MAPKPGRAGRKLAKPQLRAQGAAAPPEAAAVPVEVLLPRAGDDQDEGTERQPFDTNADVLPSKRVKIGSVTEAVPAEKAMSKRKKRKLEQLAQKRQSQELRAEVLTELKTVQLPEDQAALLRTSHSERLSRRDKVALARRRVALGLPLSAELKKLRKRKKPGEDDDACAPEDASAQAPSQGVPVLRVEAPAPVRARADGAGDAQPQPAPKRPAPRADTSGPGPARAQGDGEHAKQSASPAAKPLTAPTAQPLQRVRVERTEKIEEQRSKLPAVMMEQEVVEMTLANDILLVCGETGCGKSTQVPQFLYEAGFCDGGRYMIGVTQPRRVAAISVSQRVGDELNNPRIVGYQVRYDRSHCSQETRIKFMTDGILLREVQADFLCKKYSVIIIDEAHERGVNCDILIGLLSRAAQRRRRDFEEAVGAAAKAGRPASEGVAVPPPLKLIIMSATLRLCDFTENRQLFAVPPPVMRIEARTFPVTVHFARRTEEDYIKAAYRSVRQIHRQLPPGTILVFVTGRQEVHRLCRLLNSSAEEGRAGRGRPADGTEPAMDAESAGSEGSGRLEASDDEGNDFDDELPERQQAPSTAVPPGMRRKHDGEEDAVGVPSKDRAEGTSPHTRSRRHKRQKLSRKDRSQKPEQSEQGDPAPDGTATAEAVEVQGSTGAEGAPADVTASVVRPRRGRRTAGTPKPDAAPPGAGEEPDAEECDVCFRLDAEEDVVVLDPEVSGTSAEDAKDAEARRQKRIKMVKLDRSRTAGGAFGGAGFGEGPLKALPLYAQLPARMQLRPFEGAPEGERIVVVSTNVAETSVTIPNVRYVVDAGHEKRRKYRASSGISAFVIDRISKASSDQRAGRAGRLGPGHAYRLYSAAAYEHHFAPFAPIPVLHTPMDAVLLLLAFLGVPRPDVFPWPTPPPPESVAAAARRLRALGAIMGESDTAGSTSSAAVKCTALGFRLAALPVAPRYAKMLLAAVAQSRDMKDHIIGHACAIVAALSVSNLTTWEAVSDDGDHGAKGVGQIEHELVRAQKEAKRLLSEAQREEPPRWTQLRDDVEGLLWLMGGYAWAVRGGDEAAERFCQVNRVNSRQIAEAHSLMQQLGELLQRRLSLETVGAKLELPLVLKPPTSEQLLKLRSCVVDGLVDRLAVSCPELGARAYVCADLGRDTPVFIHTSSNAYRNRPSPTLLAFNEIISTTRPCMRDCVAVDPMALSRKAPSNECPLLQLGEFLPVPAPRYLRDQDQVLAFCSPSYAPLGYTLPTIEIGVPADNIFRYKVFAKALLEGEVIAGVPPRGARLLAQPSLVLHAPTNPRVAGLVGSLWTSRVGSRAELSRRWAEDGRFLLEGYLKWLPASLHEEVSISWPPIGAKGKRQ